MKNVKRVFNRKQFPRALPISLTLSSIIALEHWEVSIFLCIVVYVILLWFWISAIHHLRTDEEVTVLWQHEDFEKPSTKKVSKFSEKIQEAMKQEKEKSKSNLM